MFDYVCISSCYSCFLSFRFVPFRMTCFFFYYYRCLLGYTIPKHPSVCSHIHRLSNIGFTLCIFFLVLKHFSRFLYMFVYIDRKRRDSAGDKFLLYSHSDTKKIANLKKKGASHTILSRMLDVGDDGLSQRLFHAITVIRIHSFLVRESYSIGSLLLNTKVSGNFSSFFAYVIQFSLALAVDSFVYFIIYTYFV